MDRALSTSSTLLLCLYAGGMAVGQILFKLAAQQNSTTETGVARWIIFALNPYLLMALALYCLLTILWVWLLTFVPLSAAYPFVALAFVFTMAAGILVFHEPFSARLLLGGAMIVAGLFVITG